MICEIEFVTYLMGDIVNFKGGSDVVGPLGHPGWSWRQGLMEEDWPWIRGW